MTGGHLDDRLSALLDGELSTADEAAARAHLAECSYCTAELAAVARVRSLVRDLPPVEPARALRLPARRRFRLPAAGVAAGAAAAAAAVLVAWAPAPTHPVTPKVTQLVEIHAASSAGSGPTGLAPTAVSVVLRTP